MRVVVTHFWVPTKNNKYKKKKNREISNGAVLNSTIFFFPWTREAGEEEDFLPHFSPNFFPGFCSIRRPP